MADPIVYDFDTDDEGWTTIDNGPSTYYSTGGNSGGYFGGMDGGAGVWYYRAPVTMLGNREDYFGGTLSFDLIQADTTSPFVDDDVILGGGGITIVATLPSPPGLTWTSYSIDIEVGTFRIGSASGRIATEAEIRTVLANLDQLDIRGEYRSGADSSGLDNVILAEGPVNAPAVGQTAVTSTFDSSTEGWKFREDVAEFRHVTTGGNPGGFLEVVDAATGLVWYYLAPDAYLEDKSPFYGGLISFDLRQSLTDSQFDSEDVILRAGSTVLVFDTASNPGTGWTHYEIALDTSAAWRVGNLSGALATEQEIRDVLSNLTSFEIRGEYRTGADTGSMDNVIMQTPAGVIAGTSGDDVLVGSGAAESIYGLAGNDTLSGGASNDMLSGGAGNDVLDGGTGADTLTGGVGNDVYYVDSADVVTELSGEGTDEVRTTRLGYVLPVNVEELTGLVATGQVLVGNSLANVITGGAGNDQLDGKAGADVLFGGAGNDQIWGDTDDDTASGGLGNDTLYGEAGDDILNGDAGSDNLQGGIGNDSLDGGTGSDSMTGGDGDDIYYVDDAGDVVTEMGGGGTDTVRTTLASYQIGTNVENLVGTGAGGQTLLGNNVDNAITGTGSADTINGAGGDDTMTGGDGDDIYYVDEPGDIVLELAGQGYDIVRSTISYVLPDNVESLRILGNVGLVGTGNALDNQLIGNAGGDTLWGLDGNDTLSGGAGNDTLTGGAGNDVLDGGTGADTMTGGVGNDVYYVDSADVVSELSGEGTDEVRTTRAGYVLDANVENLTGLLATGQALVGNGLANVITGGAGNDQLDGKAGADTLVGGAGNDTYYVDDAGDVVSEMGGGGTDTVRTTLASYQIGVNVENLIGTGTGGQTLLGNNAVNTITGTGAADRINGAGGNDTMAGGIGNDIYFVGQTGDVVVELAGQGYDIVYSTADYTLSSNVESLRFQGADALNGIGNALDNQLIGNAGGDTLWGLDGVDRLYGIGGNDTLHGGIGDDFLFGGDGADTLHGEDGADFLRGDNDADVLHGGDGADNMAGGNGNDTLHGDGDNDYMFGDAGNDTLWGGTGQDTMWGGLNTDTFAFADGDTSADAALCDRIIDFAQAQGDRLDLSAMDANTLVGGDQAFNFIGASAFAGTGAASAGELRYTFVGAYTFVQGDTDGNGTADFMIRLDGNIPFTGVDVIL